ncbi:hypothetical protein KAR02_14075 [Candidatus Bipolaricaulota bacterium]|nr:hypothetical protein [Candidatus Bipolaricaulota bacterium]
MLLHNIPEWATVLGLLVSVVGFFVTIRNVLSTKTAATQAREAAASAQARMMRFDAAAELSSAVATVAGIKRLQRQKQWSLVLEQYAALRRSLVSVKEGHDEFDDEVRAKLQEAIQDTANAEAQVEEGLPNGDDIGVAKLNARLSGISDVLQMMLIQMKIGEEGPA